MIKKTTLFTSGENGYHTYRIPALLATRGGSLLAFCEGRRDSRSDAGKIDLLLRRSEDNGCTWGDMEIVWSDGENTCGNPSPVQDPVSGDILLLATWNLGADDEKAIINGTSRNTRRVFVLRSTDEGRRWSNAREITSSVKSAGMAWYATGPGAGIALERGPHKGRLLIPCDHIELGGKGYYSHVIYSDDGGYTWTLGGRSAGGTNECQVVELADGRILLNMRNADREQTNRQVAISSDGGETWTDQSFDPVLIEPICQAAIRRFSWPAQERPGVILFSNPASPPDKGRCKMTLRTSFDDARTWPVSLELHEGPAAYSDLAVCADHTIACLYEAGEKLSSGEGIVFSPLRPRELDRRL